MRRLTKSFTRTFTTALALAATFAAAGCATDEPLGGPLVAEVAAPTPRAALQRIAAGAARCWTDGALADYAVVPELDTTAGRPRILLIEKGEPGSLPALVIEARPDPVRLTSFGPLAQSPTSNRVNADIIRWSTGGSSCG